MRKANHVIHGSMDGKFKQIHRFFENSIYSRLAIFCQLMLSVLGHFQVTRGTGASFKFYPIDNLTPPHERSR